ncbi:MAG: peptidoglycan-binding protein LysM [Succinivibrio sp.]|nr:peptidoglycan-binding protein LysM [Succinivibrio sp.]
MGLFSFIKDVGQRVFGGSSAKADEVSTEELKKDMDALGLDTKGIELVKEGDKVILKGNTADQETLEKVALAMGNQKGVATVVTDEVQVAGGGAESKIYEVKKGDTLSKISKECYGDANKYMKIFEANKPMLSDPDKIYPGQKLRIPPL